MTKPTLAIFLDIDGVLNQKHQWKTQYSLNNENIQVFIDFVTTISKKYNVKIILSSTWRSGFIKTLSNDNLPQIKSLELKLKQYNLHISDKTPVLNGRSRNKEIERWLYFNNVDNFLVIDDSPEEFDKNYDKNICYVNSNTGITKKDVDKMIKMIKKPK